MSIAIYLKTLSMHVKQQASNLLADKPVDKERIFVKMQQVGSLALLIS
jgi:hypothetical protein